MYKFSLCLSCTLFMFEEKTEQESCSFILCYVGESARSKYSDPTKDRDLCLLVPGVSCCAQGSHIRRSERAVALVLLVLALDSDLRRLEESP